MRVTSQEAGTSGGKAYLKTNSTAFKHKSLRRNVENLQQCGASQDQKGFLLLLSLFCQVFLSVLLRTCYSCNKQWKDLFHKA